MRTLKEHFTSSVRCKKSVFRGPLQTLSAVILVWGFAMFGCATAGEKNKVPTFGEATAKELAFSDKRVTLVFAVDESGRVQEFRASGTKTFTVQDLGAHPLKAGSIAAFESFSIIKTTNPKVCWPGKDGTTQCVEW